MPFIAIFRLIIPFIARIPILPILAVLAIGTVYGTGRHSGVNSCELAHIKQDQMGVEKHGKIEKKVDSLGDIALDKRLCKYQRD